jgi:hypothetical protein
MTPNSRTESMPPLDEPKPSDDKPALEPVTAERSGMSAENSDNAANKRVSPLSKTLSTLAHINSLSRNRLRQGDKVSDFLMGLCILVMALLSFTPNNVWQVPIALVCDIVCLSTASWFLVNRLGILSTLTDRQAILVWDIAVGIFIFTILIFINLILAFRTIMHFPGTV